MKQYKLTAEQQNRANNTATAKYNKQLKTLKTTLAAQPQTTAQKQPNTRLEQFAVAQVWILNRYIRQGNKGIGLHKDVIEDLQQQCIVLILKNPLSLECLNMPTEWLTEEHNKAFKAVKNGLYRYYYANYMSHSTTKMANQQSSYIATAQYTNTDDISKDTRDSYQMDMYKLHVEQILQCLNAEQQRIFCGLYIHNMKQTELAAHLNKSQQWIAKVNKQIKQIIIDNELNTVIHN